jgi:hypothetical protein
VSVLRTPEVSAKFIKNYVGAHADFSDLQLDDDDPGHAMVKRFNPRKLRPVLVFLDNQGKEVVRYTGKLNDKEDALLLDRFVSERHYLMGDFKTFRAARRN